MPRKGPITWREKFSLVLFTGLPLLIAPAIYSAVAVVHAALVGKPPVQDEATGLAFYSALMPPAWSYVTALLGLVLCLIALVMMFMSHKREPDRVGWETKRPAAAVLLVSNLVVLAGSLTGSFSIIRATSAHDFRLEMLWFYAILVPAATFTYGIPMIVLSAIIDSDKKFFVPSLILTFFTALSAGPFVVLFSRSLI